MSNPLPSIPPGPPVAAVPIDKSSSLWDSFSTWASENKAVVYTVAGVAVVVTGAGLVYYLNTPVRLIPDCLFVYGVEAASGLTPRELFLANFARAY